MVMEVMIYMKMYLYRIMSLAVVVRTGIPCVERVRVVLYRTSHVQFTSASEHDGVSLVGCIC